MIAMNEVKGGVPRGWDSAGWLARFRSCSGDGFRDLRREVWESTLGAVLDGAYALPDGTVVPIGRDRDPSRRSRFYEVAFRPAYVPLDGPPEVSVVPDDCLDVAHGWASAGIGAAVLNMASRRNPGGGVRWGAGAQEEYLFRCSDYFLQLYRYAEYAGEYGLERSRHQYPLDRDFGGIFSPSVTVFRGNEASGYPFLAEPWSVDMIAVAGINRPELEMIGGRPRIAAHLVEAVRNKIRTIFRIAVDNGRRDLVLGALGCGAFRNPPEHVAELFREVLCEDEFAGAFRRICFAVKADHNSNGSANYDAFREVLDGFPPVSGVRS